MQQLPVKGVTPVSQMRGENDEETELLRMMSSGAQQFLRSFTWCKTIKEFYFGDGVAGIFAVFFAQIEPSRPAVDEYLWVVVGDIPSAYIVTDQCRTPKEAMEGYIEEMRKWVAAAYKKQTSADIIPVEVPATPESAEALEKRLDALEREILPAWFVD